MRRSALTLTTIFLVAPTLVGCNLFEKKPAMDATLGSADMYSPTMTQDTGYAANTYPAAYDTAAAQPVYEPAQQAVEMQAPAGGDVYGSKYHTVVRHDTLYALARSYYGDQRRWKEIFAANRNLLGDPNQLRVGQRLVIP